tara:strand:+ start:8694 stop:9824 length:1131 start_codon:yes stop_codon:yes gene_type:complete
MSDEKKLDFSAISFDNVVGDGAAGLETIPEPQEVEVTDEAPVSDELDSDVEDIREEESIGDEDYEDGVDEDYGDEPDEDLTVEDSDDGEDEVLEESVALEIADTLGFEVENTYADTVEGLTEFVRDISQEVAEDQIEDLFQQYPMVQQHLDYVLAGGDSEKFFEAYNPSLDYNNFQLNESDTGVQAAVLSQYFQAKGHEQEFIQEMIEDYHDSGKLYAKAEAARQALGQAQEQQRQSLLEEQQQEHAQAEAEQEEFWGGVADIIEGGNEFAGIRIPDADKASFFDYISEPIDEYGRTQRDVDYADADMNIKLAIDYLMFGGFQLEDIIDTKARTKSVQGLKDRIVRNEGQVKNARRAQRSRPKAFDPDQLDINALF